MKLHKTLLEALHKGLQDHHIEFSVAIQEKLVDFIELLNKWNTVHNLTAIRDPFEMINHHILDSFSLLAHLPETGSVLDVGTGGGLPGIPLAVARPDLSFVLLDSNQKKMVFVQQVIISLKLPNVKAVCSRVEDLTIDHKFDLVVSRALGTLASFAGLSHAVCKPEGKLIAMKGTLKPEELAALPENYTIEKIQKISISGVNDRSLVFIRIKEGGAAQC